MPSVARSHAYNQEFSQSPAFVGWVNAKLISDQVRVLRIHVGGDFYSAEYVDKWRQIIQHSRRVIFFAYTRSWRDESILPALVQLSREPNMHLWWSMDRQTGPAPLVAGVRRCYLAVDDADAATTPTDCDLLFRDRPTSVMKAGNGVLVCPTENGITGRLHHTCTSCGLCWRKQRLPRWEQQLLSLLPPVGGVPEEHSNKEVDHAGAQSQNQ